jgi:hypothetical protein
MRVLTNEGQINPLIPHQSNAAREALGFQGLRKMVVRKNLF